MGRRSRRREATGEPGGGSSRAERDAARERGAETAEAARAGPRRSRGPGRPQPPWGSFPLTELVVLLGIVLAFAGLIVGVEDSSRARTMFTAGVVLGMLGGLELAVRDHFAGYRSHTTLLSGAAAVAATVVAGLVLRELAPGLPFPVILVVAVVAFATAFPLLRRAFQRRSGGLSFR